MSDEFTFEESYARDIAFYRNYASVVQEHLRSRLADSGISVHAIFARAKEPDALREKLRRKRYADPQNEVTDLVGARVIVYYADEVDSVATFVTAALANVDDENSVDKRSDLKTREFGYRSVHIIACLPGDVLALSNLPSEQPMRFEVQVRSILDHAWAQIEHEIVYKSGISYPAELTRRLSSVAGTLEMIDREFIAIRKYRNGLIDSYKVTYASYGGLDEPFDGARLIAFMEVARGNGIGWRKADNDGKPFPRHSEASCVAALETAGLSTPALLRQWLDGSACREAVERFAADSGTTPSEVPHNVLILLAAATKNMGIIKQQPSLFTRQLLAALENDE
jgi:ppGpp synthetase/RelA/SpoT-type nucleotidyltranferase